MEWKAADKAYMQLCLDLAVRGYGHTSPNPMVGAVIVNNEQVIGQGYHHFAGGAHAEIEALKSSRSDPRGATLYVNLEPCCFEGKTPPCTDAIIKHGIRRVVAAMTDPNPRVSGQGLEILRQAGIEVSTGLLGAEAHRLNEVFIKFISTNTPFVVLKSAMSFDGKISTSSGVSKWITSLEARKDAHWLRRGLDAVLVGIDTVLADDPDLTVRHVPPPRQQPLRVVIDSYLRIPLGAKLVTSVNKTGAGNRTLVATSSQAPAYKKRQLEDAGVEVLIFERDHRAKISLNMVLEQLAIKNVTGVLIEGGPTIAAGALREHIVDKVIYYLAPKLIGGHGAPGPVGGRGVSLPDQAHLLQDIEFSRVGSDLKLTAYLQKSPRHISRLS